ncbi:MAG: SNARE-binding exocyst subunit S6 [Phylliscum demangeonii]|nr:MAG: SNARE-binding exocyst subunit S6 [Phylliscum demangeonii]
MNDADGVVPKLAELLRHPDDLDKIPALKAEFTRKKAAMDSHLRDSLKEQLDVTQAGMNAINDGQQLASLLKQEMMRVDRLGADAQKMLRDFPQIGLVAQTQRNFLLVEQMRSDLDTFNERVARVEELLRQDSEQLETLPNLLTIHQELSGLRLIREGAMDQIKKASDASLHGSLEEFFSGLDHVVAWFDEHIGLICLNMIPLTQNGNTALVVRLAVVIEEEERHDERVTAMQEAQKEYGMLASRLTAVADGPKELRGYKEKFLESIRVQAQAQFEAAVAHFLEEADKLEKSLRWFFNELNTVKLGMVQLMPKKWRILATYGAIYHGLMHDELIKLIDHPDLPPANLLAIIHWSDKYYEKMAKLGFGPGELQPHVIDNRQGELVREWRQLIIKFLDEWMARIAQADATDFAERRPDSLDHDRHGYFRTRNLVDLWRMLREQTMAAGTSARADVTEGVMDAMFRVLKTRQSTWQRMVDDECGRFINAGPSSAGVDQDGYQSLQDWLTAVANDQIACIDDHEEAVVSGGDGDGDGDGSMHLGYLSRFKQDFAPLVSAAYLSYAEAEMDSLRDGYVDLSTHCIAAFVALVFAVDVRPTLTDFFTARWYGEAGMGRIISTFEDYLIDYAQVLHHSLVDIFIEELADALLTHYLSAVHNKAVKFDRSPLPSSASASSSSSSPSPPAPDPSTTVFEAKLRDDVLTAFAFFDHYPALAPAIKQKWRVLERFAALVTAPKPALPDLWIDFRRTYWDAKLTWIEAVLRARDDFDRATWAALKTRTAAAVAAAAAGRAAAEADGEAESGAGPGARRTGGAGGGLLRGPDTVMGKVR